MLDKIGITVCIIVVGNNIEHRNLFIHGRALTQERPEYLDEVTVVHAMRTLKEWWSAKESVRHQHNGITLRAGSYKVVEAIRKWFAEGQLELKAVAAVLLLRDLNQLETWLDRPITLLPFDLPDENWSSGSVPWTYRAVLNMAEEFRSIAMPKLGLKWQETLPGIPSTRDEVKSIILRRHRQDELIVFRLLSSLDSESAVIITRWRLTRDIISAALAELQRTHKAQINLLSIICGTRFKYYKFGMLVPTKCPHERYGVICGREDGIEHLLKCYSITERERNEIETVDFLVDLALRTRPSNPKGPVPLF